MTFRNLALLIFVIATFGCDGTGVPNGNNAKVDAMAQDVDRIVQLTGWKQFEVEVLDETEDGIEYLVTPLPAKAEGFFRFRVESDGTVVNHPVP